MRLWSLHPKYLDCKGLLALWREGLLARKVLENKTLGYINHPQLERFRQAEDPLHAINAFLSHVYIESQARCYNFDIGKIILNPDRNLLPVTKGQLLFELDHLLSKLILRDRNRFDCLSIGRQGSVKPNPVFYPVDGEIEPWERIVRSQPD